MAATAQQLTIGSLDAARPRYDAIVVGSGYGGGVAAARLSRMGLSVALLEQGRAWHPGDFPTTASGQLRIGRLTGRLRDRGNPTGLYYLSVGYGLTVFGAAGLGGGSLINAGVALRPDLERLRRLGWPSAVLDDGLLLQGLAEGERMLGVAPAPDPERFAKCHGMRRLADAAGGSLRLPAMTIAHRPGALASGIEMQPCRYCGDCWSGCNAGAKITTAVSYVADAVNHGVQVFCESRVKAIAKAGDGWRVEAQNLASQGPDRAIEASVLVLAAGTLGTNELLLRARAKGLALSDRLGHAFSANGDDLVFADKQAQRVNAVATGYPSKAPSDAPLVGPHSMAIVDLADADGPLWVHDGTMLTVMASLAPLAELMSLRLRDAVRIIRQGIYGEELGRSQILYIVAQDDASGRLRLQNDRVVVDWPSYSTAPDRLRAEAKVRALIERSGAVFNSNPFAMTAFGGNRIIAHPLGGCGMGDTVDSGVVAHDGRVFDPTKGPTGVYDGLYVCDGAAVPSSVGVSPLLTITALAERAMTLAAARLCREVGRGSLASA